VTVVVYAEGGVKGKGTLPDCRRGFSAYFRRVAPDRPCPRTVVCGSRDQALKRFVTAVLNSKQDELCVLLIDSEGPVTIGNAVAHLTQRDHWNFPELGRHKVFLMVQAMEAWFFADRKALADYYGPGFRSNALRGNENDIEAIRKDDLVPSLVSASRATETKGSYDKAKHAFDPLTLIDPNKVGNASPRAAALNAFLRRL
jgi:hypothetical protein